MTMLFRRAWKVQVDTLDVSALDLEFKILCSSKPQPNRCALTIWNLNGDHRAKLIKRNRPDAASTNLVGIPVQVEAGYVGNTSVLFSGDLREVSSQRNGADWRTAIAGDDGGRSYREARINTTFTKGIAVSEVVRQCAAAMGIGIGNAPQQLSGIEMQGIGATLPHTFVASGSAAEQLTRVLNSVGLKWSVQRGALQVLQKGKPLEMKAILLSPDSGLLGSPEASIDATVSLGNPQQFAPGAKQRTPKPERPKDPGVLKVRSLLMPGLFPGRKIVLQSDQFNGGYMISEVEYVGQTWSSTWEANMVVRLY